MKKYLLIVLEIFCWLYFIVIIAAFNSISHLSRNDEFDLALFKFCCIIILIGLFTTGFVVYRFQERDEKYELDQKVIQEKIKE